MTERVTPDVRADAATPLPDRLLLYASAFVGNDGAWYEQLRLTLREAAEALSRLDTLERAEHERDFWKGRYDVQHRKVHAMEDAIAELRARLRAAEKALREIANGSWNFGNLRPGLTVMEFARAALAGAQAPAPESTNAPLAPTGEAGGREADARHKTSHSVQAPAGEDAP